MGSFMMGVDQDKKEEGKLTKTTRDRCVPSLSLSLSVSLYIYPSFSLCLKGVQGMFAPL